VVLTSANLSGKTEAIRADEVVQTFADRLALIIDDGPSPLGRASTVVQIQGEKWKVIREGLLSTADLKTLAAAMIVFVCTGNTCRSPLAEVLCKKMLANHLQCAMDELPQKGFLVRSAGLAAYLGDRATLEAVETARQLGADLQRHFAQPVTRDLVFQADYLIVMTQGHVQSLLSRFPYDGPKPLLFCPQGAEVPDPIGCDMPAYQECAILLQNHLESWVKKFLADDCSPN
jgi:protein-tyrosine phosphatase